MTGTINSVAEAVKILNTETEHVPFEAIRFLRNQPTTKEILSEILFSISHIHDEYYYDKEIDDLSATPLWWGIVAEAHLDKTLIGPVIGIFTEDRNIDHLYDQYDYVLGLLSKKYTDFVIEQIIQTVNQMLNANIDAPYHYLFDAFHYVDMNKYKAWYLSTLKHPNLIWFTPLAGVAPKHRIKEVLPIIQEYINNADKDDRDVIDLKEFVEELDTGKLKYPEISKPYSEFRGSWEKYYKQLEIHVRKQAKKPASKPIPKRLPDRRALEITSFKIGHLLEQKKFNKESEIKEYLNTIMKTQDMSAYSPKTKIEEAQIVMYKAFDTEDKKERIKLAQDVLKISKDCADAYVLLAEEKAKNSDERLKYYEEGIEAGKRALGAEFFKTHTGSFWGITETRPYMRALLGYAQELVERGNVEKGIETYRYMLKLNPNDNQGVRYLLLSELFETGEYDEIKRLLASKIYADDSSVEWMYSKALISFITTGPSGESKQKLVEAVKINNNVIKYLLGNTKMDIETMSDYYTSGSEDEAKEYVLNYYRGWIKTPGAIAWLGQFAGLVPNIISNTGKVGRNDPCPCGSGKKYKKCCGRMH